MADLAVVALGIDSTGVKSGAADIGKALGSVEAHMTSAEKSFSTSSQKMATESHKTAVAMKEVPAAAGAMSSALNQVGGPVGSLTTYLGAPGQAIDQLQAFVSKLGLVGGVAAGALSALAALAGAFTTLVIAGSKLSDELGDIAESSNLSLDSVQRLGAAYALSGEPVAGLEKAFKTYSAAVYDASQGSEKSIASLKAFGQTATSAGDDLEGSFLKAIIQLKQVRGTLAGNEAAMTLFSKGTFALTRTTDNLALVLGKTREELEKAGVISTLQAVEAGGRLDNQINALSHSWGVFQQNLADTTAGETAISFFEQFNKNLSQSKGLMSGLVTLFGTFSVQNLTWQIQLGQMRKAYAEAQRLAPPTVSRAGLIAAGQVDTGKKPGVPGKPGAVKAPPPIELAATEADITKANQSARVYWDTLARIAEIRYGFSLDKYDAYTKEMERIETGFREAQLQNAKNTQNILQDQLATLKPGTDNYKKVNDALNKVNETVLGLANQLQASFLPQLDKFLEKIKDIKLPLPKPPATEPPPGLIPRVDGKSPEGIDVFKLPLPKPPPIFPVPGLPLPVEERSEKQQALDRQFESIFDNFLHSIIMAEQSLGEAFRDLTLNILDTFVNEFIKNMQTAFIKPLTEGLTDMLTKMLEKVFGGLTGAGSGGIGGAAGTAIGAGLEKNAGKWVKDLGKFFAGLFAEGGTIPAGKFGVVGERGPELAFSGSSPMQIMPFSGKTSGGNVFNITIPVHSQGQVDKRTQDQIAATVMMAVKRAQRNEGAR